MKKGIIILVIGLLIASAGVRLVYGTESEPIWGTLLLLGGGGLSIIGIVQIVINIVQKRRRRR